MQKLEIIVNNNALDLGEAILHLEKYLRVRMFADAAGSKVFNLVLPATKNNDNALGYQRKLLNTMPPLTLQATVRYNGSTVLTGIMLIKQTTRLGYEVSIGFANGEFYYQAKNVMLPNCTYDDIVMGSTLLAVGAPLNGASSAGGDCPIDITDVSDPSNIITNNTLNNSFITAPADGYYSIGFNFIYSTDVLIGHDIIWSVINTTTSQLLGRTTVPWNETNVSINIKNFYCHSGDTITISADTDPRRILPSYTFGFSSTSRIYFIQADYMQDLLDENNASYPTSKYAVYPVRNEVFGAGSTLLAGTTYQNPMEIDTGTGTYFFLRTGSAPITPFFYLNYVLSKAIASIGWVLDFNWLTTQAEWKDLTIYNNFDVSGQINFTLYGTPSLVINAKDHVPNMSVWELVNTVCQALNLVPTYNEEAKTIKMEDGELIGEVLQVEDWEDASEEYIIYNDSKPAAMKIVQEVTQDTFYAKQFGRGADAGWTIAASVANRPDLPQEDAVGTIRQTYGDGLWYIKVGYSGWSIFSTVMPLYITGAEPEEVQQKWMSVYMTGYQPIKVDAGTEQLYCPQLEVVGRSAWHTNTPEVLTDLRLLFYRGLVECVMNTTVAIPLGSSTPARKEQPSGVTQQSGINCALWYEAEHFKANSGIVAQRYAKTLAWLANAKPVEVYKRLTPGEIKRINTFTKYRIGGGLLTAESIETDLQPEGITTSIIKGYLK